MKRLITFFFLISYFYSQGQNIKLASVSKTKFLVGEKAEIITEQDGKFFKSLLLNKISLELAGESIEYQIDSFIIDDKKYLKWRFIIPSNNKFVGSNKEIEFNNGSNNPEIVKINIFSKQPELIDYEPKIVFSDLKSYQTIKLKLNNVSFVNRIKFVDSTIIAIKGTSSSYINSSSYGFKADPLNNTITINIKPNNCSTLNFWFYYTQEKDLKSVKTELVKLDEIILLKSHLKKRFKINSKTDLYIDDFEDPQYQPVIIFEFGDSFETRKRYKIISDDKDLKVSSNSGDNIFNMPNDGRQNVEIVDIKKSGKYEIKVIGVETNDTFLSILNVHPKPVIKQVLISNSNENRLVKKLNNKYSIKILGNDLHKMSNLNPELINIKTSESFPLQKEARKITDNSIDASIQFGLSLINDYPIGNYKIQLTRKLLDSEIPKEKSYILDNSIISIEYPKDIIGKPEITLVNQYLFKEGAIRKSHLNLKNTYVLEKNSPLVLKISASPKNSKNIPQYYNVTAKYFKADGKEVQKSITESGRGFIKVDKEPKFFNLKDELGIEELKVNEKVEFQVSHSPDVYSANNTTYSLPKKIYRGERLLDRMGITLSLPPYLVAFRKVKRKNITENSQTQEKIINYDGEEKIEFQPLTINAGLGFKYRQKNNSYEPAKWSLGLYLMGLDFANKSSDIEQKEDEGNHNFITRGSFNILLLGELSFRNLDNPNTRIPLYLGGAYIIDPIDGGSNFAIVFGLGIDIKLFGQN